MEDYKEVKEQSDRMADSQQPEEKAPKSIGKTMMEYVKMIAVVVLVVVLLDGVILINAKIPSASMEQTIMTGDRIFGFRLAYGFNLNLFGKQLCSYQWAEPERFDIVIFHYPDDESKLYIKRVIGLPGDKVELRDGKVYINDSEEPLDDSFINGVPNGRGDGIYQVPEGCYFMLGDNRNNSKDSRMWTNKYVRFDQIVGKAIFRYFPTPKILANA